MVDGGLWRGKEGAVVNQHGGRISIALWARVLISKYGGWRTLEGERRGSSESAWWKDINSIALSGEDGSWLDKGIKWKVGCLLNCNFSFIIINKY